MPFSLSTPVPLSQTRTFASSTLSYRASNKTCSPGSSWQWRLVPGLHPILSPRVLPFPHYPQLQCLPLLFTWTHPWILSCTSENLVLPDCSRAGLQLEEGVRMILKISALNQVHTIATGFHLPWLLFFSAEISNFNVDWASNTQFQLCCLLCLNAFFPIAKCPPTWGRHLAMLPPK